LEILDLRHFAAVDLRPLLDEEIRTWARELCWDYTGSADMILRYVDAKILPGYAAVDRGRVIGYSFFVYEGAKGVIGDLYVSRESKPELAEVEARLLVHVIETLQQSPGNHRIEAQLLLHEAGKVARPFVDQGFQRHERLFMIQPLKELAPRPASPPEIEFRPWSDQDYQAAAGVITASYREHVDAQINDQYRTVSGALRFLNNIVRFPGCGVFDIESSFVAIHRASQIMVGTILCSRIRHDVGHVTQVCVLPEFRSRRIGEVLLAATASNLRKRGFSQLSLTVTKANRRAVELYERLGFVARREFDAFVWSG
jgi:ribosomal protein S18 acetylase RimI-like enzyme